jgi:hypothetical protein
MADPGHPAIFATSPGFLLLLVIRSSHLFFTNIQLLCDFDSSRIFIRKMAQMPESDFASFLDIDLDLAFYDAEAHQKQPQQHSTDQIEQQNAVFDFSLPLDVQFSMAQQQQSQAHALQSGIPPTPNSVEMHSATTQYLQHMEAQQRAIIDQYHLKRPQVLPPPYGHDAQVSNLI